MGVAGTVTMPGQEPVLTMAPERFAALKLRNAQTNESIRRSKRPRLRARIPQCIFIVGAMRRAMC